MTPRIAADGKTVEFYDEDGTFLVAVDAERVLGGRVMVNVKTPIGRVLDKNHTFRHWGKVDGNINAAREVTIPITGFTPWPQPWRAG